MNATMVLNKLGGLRFQSMVRARDFDYQRDGLSFRLAGSKNGIDRVTILFTGEHYTMLFFRGPVEVASVSDIDSDQLRAIFDRHAGS